MAGFYETLNKKNYLKAMSGEYTNYGINADNLNDVTSGSSVSTTISFADNIKNAQSLADSTISGENHDDSGTWWDKSMNVFDNVLNNIFEGIFNFADSIGDFTMGIVGGIAGAVGNTDLENSMKNAINTDWQANAVQAINATNKTMRKALPWNIGRNNGYDWDDIGEQWTSIGSSEEAREQLDKVKNNTLISGYGGNNGKSFVNTYSSITQSLGEMIPSIATGHLVTSVVNPSVAKTANIVTQASLGTVTGMGKGYETVAKEDGSLASGSIYAGIKGAISGATRGLSAGLGGSYSDKMSGAVGTKTAEVILGKGGSENVAKAMATISNIATDSLIEGGEEFVENLLDPALKQISYDQEAIYKAYGTDENIQKTLSNAIVSAGISALTTALTDTARGIGNGFSDSDDMVSNAKQKLKDKRFNELTNGLIETAESEGDNARVEKIKDLQNQNEAIKENLTNAEKEYVNKKLAQSSYEYEHKGQDLTNDEGYQKVKADVDEAENQLKYANNLAEETTKTIVEEVSKEQDLFSAVSGTSKVKQETSTNDSENKLETAKNDEEMETTSNAEPDMSDKRNYATESKKYKYDDIDNNEPENLNTKKILTNRLYDKDGKLISSVDKKTGKITKLYKANEFRELNSDGTIKAKLVIDESKPDGLKNARVLYKCEDSADVSYMLENKALDSKEGRIITINGSFINDGTHDVYVDTTKVGNTELTQLSKALTDTNFYNTTYYDKATGKVYVENSKGIGFLFDTSSGVMGNKPVYVGTAKSRPDFATKENAQVFETLSKNYKSPSQLIRDASRDNSIGQKDLYDSVETLLTKNGDVKYSKDVKEAYKKMVTAYDNHKADENTRNKLVDEFADRFFNGISSNITNTKGNDAKLLGVDKTKFRDTLKNLLDSSATMNDVQTDRFKLQKQTFDLESMISTMQRTQTAYDSQEKAFNSLQKKIANISPTKFEENKFERMNAYTAQYGNLKYNRSKGGITAESLNEVLNGELQYNQDSLESIGLGDLYDENIEETIDTLKSHFRDGKYVSLDDDGKEVEVEAKDATLTLEDAEAVSGLLKMQNQLTKASVIASKVERKKRNMNLLLAVESLQYGNKRRSSVMANIQKVLNSTIGNKEKAKILLGEGTQAYQTFVGDVVQDKLDTAYMKANYTHKVESMAEQYNLDMKKLSAKNVEIQNGETTETLKKGVAMEIYLNSLSQSNLEKMMSDGFSISGAKHNAISEDYIKSIEKSLTDDEKNFVNDIFNNMYNGELKNELNSYSKKRCGFEIFNEESYVNREIDQAQVEKEAVTPQGLKKIQQQKVGNLGSSISVKRNGNRSAMNINDIFQHLDRYIESVAEYCNSDHIKNLNTAMNMRSSQDYNTADYSKEDMQRGFAPDSMFGMFSRVGTRDNADYGANNSKYNKQTQSSAGAKFVSNWLKIVNGIDDTNNSSHLLQFFNNAMSTPIGANPSTYAKMYLDPFRMVGKEIETTNEDGTKSYQKITWGTFFKGLMNAFNSRTMNKNSTDSYKTIQNSSKYYASSNNENYAVGSSVVGVQLNKFNSVFTYPLQQANNAMMSHIAFPVMQQFAKQCGYGDIGSDTNTEQALNFFDTYASSMLSNSDSLDVSDLRAGRNGAVLRAVFGIYGGDSQKKIEQLSDIVLGNDRSKRRVVGYQAMLDKYEGENGEQGTVIYEYKQREQEALENYKKISAEYEQTDSTGARRRTSTEVMVARSQYESAKTATQSIQDTMDSFKERIDFEQNHVQNAKNNVQKGSLVISGFVVACLAEAGINSLTNVLKGKKDEESLESYVKDFAEGATYSWIPYVSTLANAYKYAYGGITPLQYQGLTNAISAIKSTVGLFDGNNTSADYGKAVDNAMKTIGSFTGIPYSNLMTYLKGGLTNLDDMTGNSQNWITQTNAFLSNYNSSTLKSKVTSALESGNLSKATEYTQANMAFFKAGAVDWNIAKEIARTGATVKDQPDVSSAEKDKFMNIYAKANSTVKSYINSSEYKKLSDDSSKGSALTKIYNAYYDVANAVITNNEEELSSKLSKALYAYYKTGRLTTTQKQLLKQYKMI